MRKDTNYKIRFRFLDGVRCPDRRRVGCIVELETRFPHQTDILA